MLDRFTFGLNSSQKMFLAEMLGTFGLVLFATGSIVFDARMNEVLGLVFIASVASLGISLMVYAFGNISMAHLNPAITVGFLITNHVGKKLAAYYVMAQIVGAFLASLTVAFFIGSEANLGANTPNFTYSILTIFGAEVLATSLLMVVILVSVRFKGLKGFGGLAIGGTVGLDILLFASISGASMNPARSLAPAVFAGVLSDLWLYWSAPFIGASIAALIYRRIFATID